MALASRECFEIADAGATKRMLQIDHNIHAHAHAINTDRPTACIAYKTDDAGDNASCIGVPLWRCPNV